MTRKLVVALTAIVVGISTARGATADEKKIDFERDIRPIFATACTKCHGAQKREGGLRLDARSFAMSGGDSGEVILPDKPEDSDLLIRVTSNDADVRMPPEGQQLTKKQIELLTAWIESGAEWPDDSDKVQTAPDHWSFKPVSRPELPDRAESNPIDRFIRARLAAEGLKPSGRADRYTLLRRLSLDLTGLPPTSAEINRFIKDESDNAWSNLVDRLLQSPHFGEKWAMQWLDLARYADSDGYEKDLPRPHAWRWRNWLINAINRDLPFDQFTVQQLAGDLLPGATRQVKLATGFHRNTLTNREGGVDAEEFRVKAAIDRVNTTMSVWMGLTAGCAQCHTHKYDPITQREFYSLYAFFNEMDEQDLDTDPEPTQQAAYEKALAAYEKTLNDLTAKLSAERPDIERRLGAWVDEQRRTRDELWKPVEVVSRRQTGGPIGGGVILGEIGSYEIVAKTNLARVSGIRVTVSPSEKKSAQNGFVLAGIETEAVPAGDGKSGRLLLNRVRSDEPQNRYPYAVLKNGPGGWSVDKSTTKPASLLIGTADKTSETGLHGNKLQTGSQDGATNLLNVFHSFPIPGSGTIAKVHVFTMAKAGSTFGAYLLRREGSKHSIVYRQNFKADGNSGERVFTLDPVWQVQPGDVFAHSGNGGPTFVAGGGTHDVIYYPLSKLPPQGESIELPKLPRIPTRRYSMQVEFQPTAVDYDFVQPNWDDKGATLTFRYTVIRGRGDQVSFAVTDTANPLSASVSDQPDDIANIIGVPDDKRSPEQQKRLFDWFANKDEAGAQLKKQIAAHRKKTPGKPRALIHTIKSAGSRRTHVHVRGDFKKKGLEVQPGTPSFLADLVLRGDRPDRLDLARWIVDSKNPLTTRVAVNHVWAQLFGQGLVRTTEDFGTQGESPSHPELLDWLATELPRIHWSRKALIRLIVLSETYRQSSTSSSELRKRDPENRLLARQNRFRLEAELVRDQYLAASDLLVRKVGGRSFRPPLPESVTRVQFVNNWKADSGESLLRRGVYIHLQRNLMLPMLMTFDRPEAILSCTRRDRSNTPLQALTLLNAPVFLQSAQSLAASIATDESLDGDARIAEAFQRIVCRQPTSLERVRVRTLLTDLTDYYSSKPDDARKLIGGGHAKFWKDTDVEPHFAAAWVVVSRTLLNLDEVITRE